MATPSPGGAVSRLALKQTPLDTWSTREHLALASAVVRSGDQNWMSVSRAMRGLADPGRPPDWCSQKNCAQQYARLLERVDTPRRKRERGESNDTPGESIVRRLRQDRTDELRRQVADTRTAYAALKAQIRQLRSGQLDARLDEIQREIQAEKDAAAQETERQRQWLADREAQKLAVQEALRAQVTKAPPPKRRKLTLDPRDSSPSETGSVLSEADFVDSPASEAPAAEMSGDETSRDATETRPAPASPLLTSLLRSPSAGRPGAVAAAAAAAGVSEAGASAPPAGSPTLSRLLELPPGTPGHAALPRANLFPEQKTEPNGETPAPAASGEQKAAVEVKQEPVEASASGTSAPATPAAQRPSAPAEPAASSVTEIKVEPPPSEETSSSKEESAAESDSGVSDRVTAETTTPAAGIAAAAVSAAAVATAAAAPPVATASPVKAISITPPAASVNAPAAAAAAAKPPAAAATAVAASANTATVTATPTAAAATTAAVAVPAATSAAAAASVSTSSASDKAFNDMIAAAASVTGEKTAPVTESMPEPPVTKTPPAAQPETARRSSDAEPKAAPETAVKEVKADPEPESAPASEPVPTEAEVEAAPEPPAPEDEVVATGGGGSGDGPGASAPAPAVVKQEPVDTEGEEDVPAPAPVPAAEEVTPRPPPPPVKEEREESDADSAASSQAPCTSRARSVSARSEPASQESVPNSPASGVLSGDDDERRDYKLWKKSILLLWREFAAHRHASKFARPITNDQASNYRAIVKSPMDLAQLKRNVETGVVTTTPQFQRDMMLMFCNAMMFNATEHEVHRFALEMQTECVEKLQLLTSGDQPAGPAVKRRETRESSRDEMKRKRSTDERPTPTRKRR